MISLTAQAEDADQLRAILKNMLNSMSPQAALAPVAEVLAPEPVKEPARRGRPPAQPKPTAEPVQTDIEDVTAVPVVSYDEVVNACKNLLSERGMPELQKFLKSFGVEQTKALKSEQYADVVAKAKVAIA